MLQPLHGTFCHFHVQTSQCTDPQSLPPACKPHEYYGNHTFQSCVPVRGMHQTPRSVHIHAFPDNHIKYREAFHALHPHCHGQARLTHPMQISHCNRPRADILCPTMAVCKSVLPAIYSCCFRLTVSRHCAPEQIFPVY